ncbi:hypothetical protein A2954_00750 [Candidatus Roizmanbacteria bacterium RIFCSPLOWO2_01_FULL_37_12]|uniref:Uncharacterized protein n=1 Tax=Candidatus Roizmanbacteria bacterium RIFCSPLOWO2_01_FULL_37_12 TaxID=1802056 RepID=A0A1F7IDT0_9BACT|nr:MAG: hypothetical protein A2954_00750 [Candidatus Roizmanbacteria bacterium RIFCSPLOWO2_01_FULL_37_12]
MDSRPVKISIFNKIVKRRRIIHLVTRTKEKSFLFASINSKNWVKKYGFPFSIKVSYGMHLDQYDKWCESINWKECENIEEFEYALEAFVKDYM